MSLKKYNNGLVLGKFYGMHKGHLHLIDTALENCNNVTIIICHNSSQSDIPGNIRMRQMKEIYKKCKSITITEINDEGFPQHDFECNTLDEFYSYWIPPINKLVNDLDVVFTSEDYGESFAKYLGVDHFLVDKQRKNYPISGTLIRSNPFKYWDFIPDQCRSFYVKKIAILGPESVGKTTLSQRISNRFMTNFVPEYGRLVYETKNGVTLDDFLKISIGRQSLEDWLSQSSNKLLFTDTEDIVTYIFSKLYYPNDYKKHEDYFIKKIKSHRYDLYFLLRPDCDPVQDGTRNFLNERWKHFKLIKDLLISFNIKFFEISGNWDDRYKTVIRIIKDRYNI